MATSCTINCNVNSAQEIEIGSDHPQIEVLSTSELKFSLDIDNDETVIFTVPDFNYQGDDYTVTVTCTEGGSSTTWARISNGSASPEYSTEVVLDLDIVATESGSGQLSGGGIIRIRTKGKPDLRAGGAS